MNNDLDFSSEEAREFWKLRGQKERKWSGWSFYGIIIACILILILMDLNQISFNSLIGCLFLVFSGIISLGLKEADILHDRINMLNTDIYELKHSKNVNKSSGK